MDHRRRSSDPPLPRPKSSDPPILHPSHITIVVRLKYYTGEYISMYRVYHGVFVRGNITRFVFITFSICFLKIIIILFPKIFIIFFLFIY